MTATQKKLLVIAAVLAACQFLLLPLIAWQQQTQHATQLTADQIQRINRLIAQQPGLSTTQQQLSATYQQQLSQLARFTDLTTFKLQQQQNWRTLAASDNLRFNAMDWLTEQTYFNEELWLLSGSIDVTGELPDLARFYHYQLQADPAIKLTFIEFALVPQRATQQAEHYNMQILFELLTVPATPSGETN